MLVLPVSAHQCYIPALFIYEASILLIVVLLIRYCYYVEKCKVVRYTKLRCYSLAEREVNVTILVYKNSSELLPWLLERILHRMCV